MWSAPAHSIEVNAANVQVKNNIWRSGTAKSASEIEVVINTVTGVTSYAIDTSGKTPFGLGASYCKSIGFTADGPALNPGGMWYDPTTANTGVLRMGTGVAGRAIVTLLCHEGDRDRA